jgi:redox-sensitive bicupin YhaK (pirin superfamily)
MHSHTYVRRPPRASGFGEAIRLLPIAPAPLWVRRDAEIMVDTGPGWLVRWRLASGPWSTPAPVAIGALRGFHHAILAPCASWPMHIHEDVQAVTYVVEGALEHSDSLGNRGVLAAGGVQQRWLGWGSEHHDRNPSATERTEFIQTVAGDAQTRSSGAVATQPFTRARALRTLAADCTVRMLAVRRAYGCAGCRSTCHPTWPVEQADRVPVRARGTAATFT